MEKVALSMSEGHFSDGEIKAQRCDLTAHGLWDIRARALNLHSLSHKAVLNIC